jgi:hypothetical protein
MKMKSKELFLGIPKPEQILRMTKDKSYAEGFKEGYILGGMVGVMSTAAAVCTNAMKRSKQ